MQGGPPQALCVNEFEGLHFDSSGAPGEVSSGKQVPTFPPFWERGRIFSAFLIFWPVYRSVAGLGSVDEWGMGGRWPGLPDLEVWMSRGCGGDGLGCRLSPALASATKQSPSPWWARCATACSSRIGNPCRSHTGTSFSPALFWPVLD